MFTRLARVLSILAALALLAPWPPLTSAVGLETAVSQSANAPLTGSQERALVFRETFGLAADPALIVRAESDPSYSSCHRR